MLVSVEELFQLLQAWNQRNEQLALPSSQGLVPVWRCCRCGYASNESTQFIVMRQEGMVCRSCYRDGPQQQRLPYRPPGEPLRLTRAWDEEEPTPQRCLPEEPPAPILPDPDELVWVREDPDPLRKPPYYSPLIQVPRRLAGNRTIYPGPRF